MIVGGVVFWGLPQNLSPLGIKCASTALFAGISILRLRMSEHNILAIKPIYFG